MSNELSDRPKLRWPLDTEPFEHQGEQFLVLRDRLGIAPEAAVIPLPLVPVVSRFDGTASLADIAKETTPFGLDAESLVKLAAELDRMGFLHSPQTAAKIEKLHADFKSLAVRPAALAGLVYPADPNELKQSLDEYIHRCEKKFSAPAGKERIAALICPHIDYQRGWQSYGSAYSILEQVESPDVIFLLGTSHQGGESLFQLTRKAFASPLGTLSAADEIIQDIVVGYGEARSFRDEFLHKHEHSLELQVPFLAHRYRAGKTPRLVPILVGSFHETLTKNSSPLEKQEIADFIGVFAAVLKNLELAGKKVLIYGGVDLAHVGQNFGDKERISTEAGLQKIRTRDEELLDRILRPDEEALFAHIAEDGDARRICGFPSIYTMLAAMRQAGKRTTGKLVEYRQAVNPDNDCVVTFAAGCWTLSPPS